MKNKLSLLKFGSVLALLALSLACGSAADGGGGNSSNSIYVAKEVNTNAAPSANSNASSPAMNAANKLVEAEKTIGLPPANPIEKGKPQKFYLNTVSFTVPANWKRTMSNDTYVRFASPDKKFRLMMNVMNDKREGDMMQEFKKIIEEKPEKKASLRALGGDTLGILIFYESQKDKSNFIYWESYPPPNSEGKAPVLSINVFFPYGEFEQHKQLISDIYGSIGIKK
ncbi:MAG: hypothetical protein LH614_06900 [Pyrinomonadaceae bacterium]|nr:hypothetical protein [Pyrinomonadaceae bacterium]